MSNRQGRPRLSRVCAVIRESHRGMVWPRDPLKTRIAGDSPFSTIMTALTVSTGFSLIRARVSAPEGTMITRSAASVSFMKALAAASVRRMAKRHDRTPISLQHKSIADRPSSTFSWANGAKKVGVYKKCIVVYTEIRSSTSGERAWQPARKKVFSIYH